MMNANTICEVKNRSSSMVYYRIPEDNIVREFHPGETRKIPYGELEKLSFQRGGRELMMNFLQIRAVEVTNELNIRREPEYNMSEKDIAELIETGSMDAYLDCLDFAPIGVIDLIKKMAVEMPMMNIQKREALKKKTGFDVTEAIRHLQEEKMDAAENELDAPATTRRVKIDEQPARRTASKYTVVEKAEE